MARIKIAIPVALLALSLASGPAASQAAEDAFGLWLNPENQSNVEFYKCGEGICAKITKASASGTATDEKNSDPAKKGRAIVGLVIMDGGKKSGASKWSGNLYNPNDGKTYAGTVTVKDKNTLDLAGCVAVVLCRSTTWTRIK